MRILRHLRASSGIYARARLRRQKADFLAATQECHRHQQQVLHSLLDLNGSSDFGKQYGLHKVRTAEEFRSAIPVTTYADYESAIERLKQGEQRAMLGANNQLLMFTLSSGTTADSKFIPVTARFFADYRRGWQIWGIDAYDAYPKLPSLKLLTLASDYQRFTTPAGLPCGNISGLAAAMQRPAVQLLYTLPFAVTKISNVDARFYTILRLALADPDVGMITTANPSTLVRLTQLANEWKEHLVRDLFDGGLFCRDQLGSEVCRRLHRHVRRKCRQRAKQLEKCFEQSGGFSWQAMWPDLQVLAVWTGGSCGAYLPSLKHAFGNVPIRDHGLSASEGRMTIPFSNESSDGVLDVTTHYFEFIPEQEYGSTRPTVLQAHELERGQNYFILLTTSSGFYRYDICDVVQCVGFRHTTPILRFLHKGAHICSITGEKLSESQVVDAVRSTLQRFQHHVQFFTLIPEWGNPPCYRLMLEDWELPPSKARTDFERSLDEQLQHLNCEYSEKRTSDRLGPVRILPLRNGSWTQFARDRQAQLGGSIEQYKHPCLLPNIEHAAAVQAKFGALSNPEACRAAAISH